MQPLISVIIPAKNRPDMLRQATESVLAQTYPNVEIIIVLTGATADVINVARDFEPSVRLLETPALNLAATRNEGLAVANGEWTAFLDDDDLWLPAKLQVQLDAATHENADLVTTNWTRFGNDMAEEAWMPSGRSPLAGMTYSEALVINNFVSVGALVRTDVLRRLGGFDPMLSACEDWDMWRRVSHFHKVAFVDQYLMRVRIHGQNMTDRNWLMLSMKMRHFCKMIFDTPPQLRYSLRRLPRSAAMAIAFFGYSVANRLSGNRVRMAWRRLKATQP